MTNGHSCFFITPIGKDGSTERINMEHVLKLMLRPILSKYEFDFEHVVTSEDDDTPKITRTILNHIENDDLCVADLTGLNPNVMFELGYRMALKKPLIIIGSKEMAGRIPFDVYDNRTAFYDSTDPFSMVENPKFENMVKSVVSSGFVVDGPVTIDDLLGKIEAIDAKLTKILSQGGVHIRTSDVSLDEIVRKTGSPIAAFNYALSMRDSQLAEALLPKIETSKDKETYIDQAVAQVAALGSQRAACILITEWGWIKEHLTKQQQMEEIGAFVSYCNRTDSEPEEIDFVIPELERQLAELSSDSDNEIRIGLLTQFNRFYYGLYQTLEKNTNKKHFEYLRKAVDYLKTAIDIDEKNDYLWFNLSICYESMDMLREATDAIEKCIQFSFESGKKEENYLKQAYLIYKKIGEKPKANEMMEYLREVNPYVAQIIGD